MSHEAISSTFDSWVESGKADRLEQNHSDVAHQVFEHLDIRAGMQTLDLGCGTGWATRILAAKAPGAGAIGIDVSSAMIKRAEALHDLTSRARYETGPFEAIDFKDGKFDRVFSMEALYYAVDLEKTLSEVHRVIKPGGLAHLVVDRYKESPHTECWAEMVGIPMHWLGEDEWKSALEAAGFAEVSTERVIDRRGAGDEASFTPSTHTPDFKTANELHQAGSLYLRGTKPE
ncbi:MAG: ubiquinone/menaquinone biosynthesis C-methylase UbiE [Planctomycetota bacterium]|jgi:ubiquinone/menaquinone biosynthesis C-methylase UbiE